MIVCRTVAELRRARQNLAGSLGLVPTMGYLHEGHLALVAASRAQDAFTAATIFVNPAQFNNPDDLAKYPRDEARDLAMLEAGGTALVFCPPVEEVYPADFQTYIQVERVSQGLEGEHRPGHFRGVATVVAKLFNLVQPQRAYFGQKDAQQVAVIQHMARDLNFPLEIVVCPTVREPDGLAMSSRNARLTPDQRRAAPSLYQALSAAQQAYANGEHDPQKLVAITQGILKREPLAQVEYVSAVDAHTLQELSTPSQQPLLLSLAVFVGAVRLIDNVILG